ncbi:aldehyde dehydrogenase family protein [Nocardia sp. NPDC052278]|uniref:aldehyde dehydrogenase family protein n=1 Tax=unclassified Nocardia TaxID=2637762 RepID=UPI003696D639
MPKGLDRGWYIRPTLFVDVDNGMRIAQEEIFGPVVCVLEYEDISLQGKKITPHTLRNSAAMELLHSGVDITVIALWLGDENPTTTRIYLHADMALKEKALARTASPDTTPDRYQAPDTLLAFLDQL